MLLACNESKKTTQVHSFSDLNCQEIESAYNEHIANNQFCAQEFDCEIMSGSCAFGLGGCHYAVSIEMDGTKHLALVQEWRTKKCSGSVCRCAAPPTQAKCVLNKCTL